MAEYRKKPIIVDAEQFLLGEKLINRVVPVCLTLDEERIICPYTQDIVNFGIRTPYNVGFGVETLEGWIRVVHGDWIITGVRGEKYPCKPDIFEETYELVED